MEERENVTGREKRWQESLNNLQEASSLASALQRLLGTALYADERTFQEASTTSAHVRMLKAQERRILSLVKELDASVEASALARAQKREGERRQREAEERAAQTMEELNNTAAVFEAHMKEIREQREELEKKDSEIEVLKAIIKTLSEKPSSVRPGSRGSF